MMHTYRKSRDENLWTVGLWAPDDEAKWMYSQPYKWHPVKDFTREDDAAAYVNYLNGGAR